MSRTTNYTKAQEWLNETIRKKYGNVAAFARAIGYSRTTVSHWLDDIGTLPFHAYAAIVDACGFEAISMLFADASDQPDIRFLNEEEAEMIEKYRHDRLFYEMVNKLK